MNFFLYQHVFDTRQPRTAIGFWDFQIDQSGFPQGFEDAVRKLATLVERHIELGLDDFLAHECTRGVDHHALFIRECKIEHRYISTDFSSPEAGNSCSL